MRHTQLEYRFVEPELWAASMMLECPRCHAQPGQLCLSPQSNAAKYLHLPRQDRMLILLRRSEAAAITEEEERIGAPRPRSHAEYDSLYRRLDTLRELRKANLELYRSRWQARVA